MMQRLIAVLQLLLGYERREQHVLKAGEEGHVGLFGQYDITLVVHGQPFQITAIRREPQSIRALQLADIDDADDFLRQLWTFSNYAEFRILARRSWIEIHRTD